LRNFFFISKIKEKYFYRIYKKFIKNLEKNLFLIIYLYSKNIIKIYLALCGAEFDIEKNKIN
jgi:hypothetical protein